MLEGRFSLILFLVFLLGCEESHSRNNDRISEEESLVYMTLDEKIDHLIKTDDVDRKEKIKKQFDSQTGSHIELVRMVKMKLRNPDSIVPYSTVFIDLGSSILVTMKYTADDDYGTPLFEGQVSQEFDLSGNKVEIDVNRIKVLIRDWEARKLAEEPVAEKATGTQGKAKVLPEGSKKLTEVKNKATEDMTKAEEAMVKKETYIRREKRAKESLRLIKRHLIGKDNNLAKKKLKAIADKFPESEIAKEASEIMNKIEIVE